MVPLFLSILLGANPALPPPLVQAIRAGEHQSHPLEITRQQAEIASAQTDAALSALLPFFNASGSFIHNQYDTVVPLGSPGGPTQNVVLQPFNQLVGTLTLQATLFDGGAIERYLASRHGREASATRVEQSRRDLQLLIAQVYYQVVAAQGTVLASQRALDTAKKNEDFVAVRYQQGTAPKLTYDKAKVDTSTAQTNLILAQRALENLRRRFATLTSLPEPRDLPEPENIPAPTLDEDALVKAAWAQRPEVIAAQQTIAQANSSKSAAWGAALPTLNANLQEHLTNAAGFVGRSSYYTAALNLNWTVDPLLTAADVHQADANIRIAQEDLAAARENVRDDVHSAILEVNANRQRLNEALAQVDNAREALQLAELKLKEGVATPLEVSQAQTDAFRAEASLALTRADYAYSLLEVRHAVGELLVAD